MKDLGLFLKLTSGIPCIRATIHPEDVHHRSRSPDSLSALDVGKCTATWVKFPTGGREEDSKGLRELHLAVKHLAEIKSKMQRVSIRKYELLYRYGESYACYSFAPWVPLTSTRGLPFQIKDGLERGGLIRSPDRKPGLADICRESKRIKEFRLSDAIVYSYCKDNRFVLFICIRLGFTIWWGVAPEPLLLKPEALSSPDLKLLVKVVKDTFIYRVCSSHPHVSSPCDCGEPLNKIA